MYDTADNPDAVKGKMKSIEGTFRGQRGLRLYYRGWLAGASPTAILVVAHGVAEHIGRYSPLAEYFADLGLAVYGFDYRGHGKSEGARGYIERFSHFQLDLGTFLGLVSRLHPGKKIFLFGHSMGGEVVLARALYSPGEINGLIVSAASLKIQPALPPALIAAMLPLGIVWPGLGMQKLDSGLLSRDKTVCESYDRDPLVHRGKITACLGIGIAWTGYQLLGNAGKIQLPVLILHGESDRLADPAGSRQLYTVIGSRDKTFKTYPGLYHEIHNEPERLQVLNYIRQWIGERA